MPAPLSDHGVGWITDEVVRTIDGLVVEREIDVYPLGDAMPHGIPGAECWCRATPDFDHGTPLYTHHSLDGRELQETR